VKRRVASCLAALAALLLSQGKLHAGAFTFANADLGVDLIAHPTGYTGSGGPITVEVCIAPSSPNASDMEIPVQNAVATWNALTPTTGNLDPSGVPGSSFDFESAALHEIGHCIGLAHPNLGSESGLSGSSNNATRSTPGSDFSFDVDDGADDVYGSADDLRDDDVNLHWFEIATNDPFQIASVVDQASYSRDVVDLPFGDLFPNNASRDVANLLLGNSLTEAAMQQGTFPGEAQRALTHDDVAMIRLAESGVDGVAGTADDYTTQLEYVGLTASCDIVVRFDDAKTAFASCSTSGALIDVDHVQITSANVYFNDGANWFFNPEARCGNSTLDPGEECDDGNGAPGDCCSASCQFESPGASCTDGAFCNGAETCNGSGSCEAGTPPPIDDGVMCTQDSCDELDDVVLHLPDSLACDDGDACTADSCDAVLGCAHDPIPGCVPALATGGSAFAPALALLLGLTTYLGLVRERRRRR